MGFQYSVGPWNIHDGADMFGGPVRDALTTRESIKAVAALGFTAIQFHDDDIVPDIEDATDAEIMRTTREMKAFVEDLGLKAEFVAPRLWEPPQFRNGALTHPDPTLRRAAIDRSVRCAEMAREMGCDLVGFWFSREGTVVAETKDAVSAIHQLVEALNAVLAADPSIRLFIEPKPNEPIDRSFAPTMGHAMALSSMTTDPERVGGLVESAHAILAGIDPAHEMAIALAPGKLFGVHLNDQNGMKFDQDKAFGVENLRQAFNQVRLLKNHGFGSKGEYVGLDVKAAGPQPRENRLQHLKNSLWMVQVLETKVAQFEAALAAKPNLDVEQTEQLAMATLMGVQL